MTSQNKATQEQLNLALLDAANRGDVDGVKAALEQGADVNAKDDIFGETALHFVDGEHGAEIVRLLVGAGADVNAVDDSDGLTPLFFVRSAAIAKALLDAGADVNARSHAGETPLHAVSSGATDCGEITRLLIGAGADMNAGDEYGELPIEKALQRACSPSGIKALIDAGAKLPARWDWAFALMRLNTAMPKMDKKELMSYIKAKNTTSA